MSLAAGGKLPYRMDVSGVCETLASVICAGGCGRVEPGCRNGMGGTTLCVMSNVGVWCSTASIADGMQTGTGIMDVSWGKAAVIVGCRTARPTCDMVSRAL